MAARLRDLLRSLGRFDEVLSSSALVLMMLIPLVEIVLRPLLGKGIVNAPVLVQHLGLVLAMFGAVAAERHGHLTTLGSGVGTLGNARLQAALQAFSRISAALICGALALASWRFVASEMEAYGLILSVLAGCVMFAVSYSKVRVIKFSFTGKEFRSCHERSAEDKALLTRNGDEIRVFVLQGFIFFGMADRLYRSIMDTSFPADGIKARFVVVDLILVHGMDASVIASFKKISYGTRKAGARMVITGMLGNQTAEWRESGDDDLLAIHYFPNLDAGAEWCESDVIQTHRKSDSIASEVLRDWLHAEVGDAAPILIDYMTRRNPVPGELLCWQDEPAQDMYFIESGRVAIELAVPGGPARRLRTLGARTILGEMGLYRSARRSADVVVQEAGVAYELSLAALHEIESAHPHAAARFHALMVRTVADRLDFSNGMVAALQR